MSLIALVSPCHVVNLDITVHNLVIAIHFFVYICYIDHSICVLRSLLYLC